MILYGLRETTPGGGRFDARQFKVGPCTRLLQWEYDYANLFTSASNACAFAEHFRLKGFEPFTPDMNIGYFLECLGSTDRCTSALVDGEWLITFLTCASVEFMLPSHFFRYRKGRYQTVNLNDEWYDVDLRSDRPSCNCGATLGKYSPCPLPCSCTETIPGLYQVMASTFVERRSSTCQSTVYIDLDPPSEPAILEVILGIGDRRKRRTYSITPEGMGVRRNGTAKLVPWRRSRLTGLGRVGVSAIPTPGGLQSVELRYTSTHTGSQRLTTGEIRGIPLLEHDNLREQASAALLILEGFPVIRG